MLWRWFTIILVTAWPTLALAEGPFGVSRINSGGPEDIALTIYTDDLALITERRTVNLPAGKSVIAFKGVSDMMIPQSAILREFSGFTLERNFDFDLITPGALFDGATGEMVTIYRTNPATGQMVRKQARVISGGSGVILEIDGKYEALKCAGLPERTAFDRVPDGLNPQPVLTIQVSAPEAGEQEVVLSYLASGFGWAADYRLDLNGDEQSGSLIGWLTVRNRTEISIENASTAIIAGDLRRLGETTPQGGSAKSFRAHCWPRGSSKRGVRYVPSRSRPEPKSAINYFSAPQAERAMADDEMVIVTGSRIRRAQQEDFGDYKLYRPPERTTVAAYQEKQLLFLSEADVELEKVYTFNLDLPDEYEGAVIPATVAYHLDNSREGKLGVPLPEGTMRVMTKNGDGKVFYLGEDSVDNLAVDLPAEFEISSAPDIQMETTVQSYNGRERSDGSYEERAQMMHTFFNASPKPVEIELKIGEDYYNPVKISQSSIALEVSSATPKWRFKVPAESSRQLTYSAAWLE